MEKELNAAKRLNKVAIVVIVIMLILMSVMTINLQLLAERYRRLESKYEQLYEEIREQSVSVGTAPETLVLPDMLDKYYFLCSVMHRDDHSGDGNVLAAL